jgi:hypothetical protein
MYNIKTVYETEPIHRTYAEYVDQAQLVIDKEFVPQDCGINGLWLLHDLPYSDLIFKSKDIMHTSYNIVKDSIRVLKPSHFHTSRLNRTKETANVNSCREYKIFTFLTSGNSSWPWIMSTEAAKEHDLRLKNVLG